MRPILTVSMLLFLASLQASAGVLISGSIESNEETRVVSAEDFGHTENGTEVIMGDDFEDSMESFHCGSNSPNYAVEGQSHLCWDSKGKFVISHKCTISEKTALLSLLRPV